MTKEKTGKKSVPISLGTLSEASYYKRRDTSVTKLAELIIAYGLKGEICFSTLKDKSNVNLVYSTFKTKEEYIVSLLKRVEEVKRGVCQLVDITEYYVTKIQLPRVEKTLDKLKLNEPSEFLEHLSMEIVNCQRTLGESNRKLSSMIQKIPSFLNSQLESNILMI